VKKAKEMPLLLLQRPSLKRRAKRKLELAASLRKRVRRRKSPIFLASITSQSQTQSPLSTVKTFQR